MQVLLNKYLSIDFTDQFSDNSGPPQKAHAKHPGDGLKSSIGAAWENTAGNAAKPCCHALCLWV